MAKQPIVLWCRCGIGYACVGLAPSICPECRTTDPQWTTLKPYKINLMDKSFLRSIKIAPE